MEEGGQPVALECNTLVLLRISEFARGFGCELVAVVTPDCLHADVMTEQDAGLVFNLFGRTERFFNGGKNLYGSRPSLSRLKLLHRDARVSRNNFPRPHGNLTDRTSSSDCCCCCVRVFFLHTSWPQLHREVLQCEM